MKLRIATRKSALALVQTNSVKALLSQLYPEMEVILIEAITEGDQIQDRSLAEMGGKGLFIKKLEEMLLAEQADIAVHSLKDVPPALEPDFCLAAVLPRHSPFDALVSNHYATLQSLPERAIVGTSSVRRQAALLHIRPDLQIKMLRGNVDTRLRKLDCGEYDALILAEAGLTRLGVASRIREVLSPECCLPSVGQGVIALECLSQREDLKFMLQALNHLETEVCITAERAMNQHLGASCTSPVGSFAQIQHGQLELRGGFWSPDGHHYAETLQIGSLNQAFSLGERAAIDLKKAGFKA